ncbi:polysaccharide deacetylase family protein [Gorillibacterium sp. sgz5001074]|uniref:polysaccharide deacetylase family protein n=1 Tax=Gorillibacterium sp. sgz5001074 TaxID=3446695 RepID=UPI003F6629FA
MKAWYPLAAAALLLVTFGCGQKPSSSIATVTQYANAELSQTSMMDGSSPPPPSASPSPPAAASPSPTPTPMPSLPAKSIHYRDKVIVLMYHHLAEVEANEEVTITPAKFESHLKVLKDRKYQVISIEDYVRFVKENQPVPPNAVVITFDDGYESYYRYGYPLLKKYGFTATNFLVTSYMDSNNPSLPFMTWKQVKEMHDAGFSFYSHSHNSHGKVRGADNQLVAPLANRIWLDGKQRMENESEYRKRIRDDLSTANQLLSDHLGNDMNILCFPLGFYNKTIMEIGNEIGIDFFFTTRDGINSRNDKEIVRIHAGTRYITSEKLAAKLAKYNDAAPAGGTTRK